MADVGGSGLEGISGSIGGIASATPWGAAAGAIGKVLSTPNTSASGDINRGGSTFGGVSIGSNSTNPIVLYGLIGAVALLGLVLLRR